MRAMFLAGCATLMMAASVEAQGEDVELDPLAELAALGDQAVDTGPEGGGSIRAKKDADLTRIKRLKDGRNVEARVESMMARGFPIVAVTLKVYKPAKEGAGKALKKNDKIVIVPRLKVEDKRVAMTDPPTLLNAGAFYLQKGDKVMVRLGAKKGKYWEAEYVERK